jgi:hypothetical protein
MMDQSTRDKVAKLPTWARELIRRLEIANEPAVNEIVMLRQKNNQLAEQMRRVSTANEAMRELFRCASVGGSDYAKAVVDVLDGYEIFPERATTEVPS